MTELTIFGRGGQGGVTLAKLIATAYFLKGKHVQAFGVYAAERSGAPLQAFVRIDDSEITNHNQVRTPDHLVVLDRTLITPSIVAGLKPGGWILLNSPDEPGAFADFFGGRTVATVDATRIAAAHGLGTRTVPIVNTTMFGAAAKLFGLSADELNAALAEVHLVGANATAAFRAFEDVKVERLTGAAKEGPPAAAGGDRPVAGLLDGDTGRRPLIRTGSWATRRPQRRHLTPPCNHVCPAGNDVQGFLAEAARGNYDAALEVLLRTSPFPGVCGRVCPAPCMDHCNRRFFDESLNVRELERYVAEHGKPPEATKPWRDERIAIVGSGPAGLSAAYTLARLGYHVTVFENQPELGGLLRTGIPPYRLPRTVLDTEINRIVRYGVEVRTEYAVDRGTLVWLAQNNEAVVVATGLQELRSLELGGDGAGVVVQGIDFLDRTRWERRSLDGEHIVVVGGGNTAVDAARTARRLGARSVRIVYRRSREQMPAIREEIDEALEEGIVLDELVAPVRVQRDSAGAVLTCRRMRLGEPDASGRRSPVPDTAEGAEFDLRCDRVILALGQSADTAILPSGSEIRSGQVFLGMTTAPVFSCGDFASNDGTVAAAIGSGRRTAWHVHRTLTGEDLFPPPEEPVAQAEVIVTQLFTHGPRHAGPVLPAGARRRSFAEVRLGLLEDPGEKLAQSEAQRCFSCGTCNQCDRCVQHCPEGVMIREGDGYRFDEGYCKGCGVCAAECPRGVIFMAEL